MSWSQESFLHLDFFTFPKNLFSQKGLAGQNRSVGKGGKRKVERVQRWGKWRKLYWGYGMEYRCTDEHLHPA
jgi:hypothetical protein